MLQRPAPIADDRGQPRTILGSNDNADFLLPCPDNTTTGLLNPMFASVH
jgi:hypothetical protein